MKKYTYNVAYTSHTAERGLGIHNIVMSVNTPFTTENQFSELITFLQRFKLTKDIVVLNLQLIEEREIDKPQTNYERIKATSIEEVANMICYCMDNLSGYDQVLKWLYSEVQEE